MFDLTFAGSHKGNYQESSRLANIWKEEIAMQNKNDLGIKILVVFIACLLFMPAIVIAKDSKNKGQLQNEKDFSETASGALSPIPISMDDYNENDPDGLPLGFLLLAEGKGSLAGQFSAHVVLETAIVDSPVNCNDTENTFAKFTMIQRYSEDDLLFSRLAAGGDNFLCLDTVTGSLNGLVTLEIIGGTGRFRGATGNSMVEFTGAILATDIDSVPGHPFFRIAHAAIVAEISGTILK